MKKKSTLPSLPLICIAMLVNLQGCGTPDESVHERLLREALVAEIKAAPKVFQVAKVASFEWERVCVLTPYQDRIAETVPGAEGINAKLRQVGFVGDEGFWAFVFIERGKVTILKVKRSADLDLLTAAQEPQLISQRGVRKIEWANCSARDNANLVPVRIDNRNYVAFGREIS